MSKIKFYLKSLFSDIYSIYLERGFAPFQKPLIFAGGVFLIIYFGLYLPSFSKLKAVKNDWDNINSVVPYYDSYIRYKKEISNYKKMLPNYKDKDEWLDYIIRNTAKNNSIVPETITAQREVELGGGLIVANKEVTVTASYHDIGKWIADIENAPIFLTISDFNLRKSDNFMVRVQFKLVTIFIKPGA